MVYAYLLQLVIYIYITIYNPIYMYIQVMVYAYLLQLVAVR
jgi:hypothetical protein